MSDGQITAIVMTNTNNSNRTVVFTPAEIPVVGEILLEAGWTGGHGESTGEFVKDRVEITMTRGLLVEGAAEAINALFFSR